MAEFKELMSRLETLHLQTERKFFHFGAVNFQNDSDKKILSGPELSDVQVSPEAFETLCGLLDIPFVYAKRCPSDLQETMVNYWLKKRSDTMQSVLLTENKIRAFMSPNYPYVSMLKIVDGITDLLPEDFLLGNYNLNGKFLEAQIFSPEYNQHVVDSEVRGGMKMVFSDSWTVAPRFDTYLYRVLCLNGMVSPLEARKFRISGKGEDEILEQVREFVKISLEHIPNMYHGFLALEQEQVHNFISLLRKICKENKLPKKIADLLIETADSPEFKSTIRNRINSMYDIVNLLTYVGTHNHVISEQHREHLMEIAGNITLKGDTRCTSCGSSISVS
jgi:hypothetical protein